MKLNLVFGIVIVVTVGFLSGIAHLFDIQFILVASSIVLATILLIDAMNGGRRSLRTTSWIGVGIFALFFFLTPIVGMISMRHSQTSQDFSHDNVIQMEEAAKFLRQGKNPYAEDYTRTPLADFNNGQVYGVTNPALFHLINLPGHLILTTGLSIVSETVFGFYDERMLYVLVFFVLAFLAYRLGGNEVLGQRWVILLALNPFLIPFTVEGRNDILLLTFLLAAFLALHRRQRTLATILFALACTLKAFAWVFAPFFLVALFARSGSNLRERLRGILRPMAAGVAVFAVIVGPFLIWNAPALIEDVIKYPGGGIPTSYPIAGNGLSVTLLYFGIIQNNTDMFPFWALQLAVAIPILAIFVPRIFKRPDVSSLAFVSVLLTFANQYVARYFHTNHLTFMLCILIIGYGFWQLERAELSREKSHAQPSA